MTPSDWAAWYGAVVSTLVAFAGFIAYRQRNAAILVVLAELHPRQLIAPDGNDLRIVVRNVGGMPTTVSGISTVQTSWRCPTWLMRWRIGRRLARLKPAGLLAQRAGGHQVFTLAAGGGEHRIVFMSWPDDRAALQEGRYWALITDTAYRGRARLVRIHDTLL